VSGHDATAARRLALELTEAIELGRRPIDALDLDALRRERIDTLHALVALLEAVDALERRADDLCALEGEHRPVDV
jgi:hypothetical protein